MTEQQVDTHQIFEGRFDSTKDSPFLRPDVRAYVQMLGSEISDTFSRQGIVSTEGFAQKNKDELAEIYSKISALATVLETHDLPEGVEQFDEEAFMKQVDSYVHQLKERPINIDTLGSFEEMKDKAPKVPMYMLIGDRQLASRIYSRIVADYHLRGQGESFAARAGARGISLSLLLCSSLEGQPTEVTSRVIQEFDFTPYNTGGVGLSFMFSFLPAGTYVYKGDGGMHVAEGLHGATVVGDEAGHEVGADATAGVIRIKKVGKFAGRDMSNITLEVDTAEDYFVRGMSSGTAKARRVIGSAGDHMTGGELVIGEADSVGMGMDGGVVRIKRVHQIVGHLAKSGDIYIEESFTDHSRGSTVNMYFQGKKFHPK